ncbi:MAG: DUF2855 family protein [Pseudomonadales bacterium]|nr:DUF2855 family protein [Pseudomonadales bacterium]
MQGSVDFQVRRDALRTTRWVSLDAPEAAPLAEGEIIVAVDLFAFTANNVTYAVFGEAMKYWDFFPAEAGWGRIPVWGFGEVVRSLHEDVKVGERLYGYFPMSSWVRMKPVRSTTRGFTDGAEHRAHLHPVYNSYQRTASDPAYRRAEEGLQMLLRPLFTTSFLIEDFFADADAFGAKQILLTSASSKTALGVAHLAHERGDLSVVGLTSPQHVDFCEGLGSYDRVLAYDALEAIDVSQPAVSVDMAGNSAVLARIHAHLGDGLKHSMLVGGTHWEARGGAGALAGPEPVLFFAPDRIRTRMADWGADGYDARLAKAWEGFVDATGAWLQVRTDAGTDAVERVYLDTLDGRVDPALGQVLTLL